VRELRTAVQLDPDSSLAHHYLGTALFNGEISRRLKRSFARPCDLQPTADKPSTTWQLCLMSMGSMTPPLTELDTAGRRGALHGTSIALANRSFLKLDAGIECALSTVR